MITNIWKAYWAKNLCYKVQYYFKKPCIHYSRGSFLVLSQKTYFKNELGHGSHKGSFVIIKQVYNVQAHQGKLCDQWQDNYTIKDVEGHKEHSSLYKLVSIKFGPMGTNLQYLCKKSG